MASSHDPARRHLHFVLFPLMAPGHIIPMIDMAKLLSSHGVQVTIIVTPLDAKRSQPVINRAVSSGSSIQVLQIRFPCEEAGLPAGCESADSLPSYDLLKNFYVAISKLQPIFESKLEEMLSKTTRPSCIICDKHLPWTADTCRKYGIPRIVFDGMSCFTQVVTHNLYVSKIHQTVPATQPFVVPGLPVETIEFTRVQLPGLLNPGSSKHVFDFREQVKIAESQSYGVVVNSYEELEMEFVDEFKKMRGGKVWCIGPLSLLSVSGLDTIQRGNKPSADADHCLKWLDNRQQQQPEQEAVGSVIYASLGSLARLSPPQFVELALALEGSNHPFILAVNTGSNSDQIEKWMREEGFEERIKERGMIIRGWAPQVLILSHAVVGGFLTHCGWNSTLEGVCAGLPMVTWPLFAEQFLNEKLVVQVLGVGVSVGAQAVEHLEEEANPEVKVRRDRIQAAVEAVMDRGEEGCGRRKRAQELRESASRSVGVGGSSYLNVNSFIQDVASFSSS